MKITDEAVQEAIEVFTKISRIKLQVKEPMRAALAAALPHLPAGYKVKRLEWIKHPSASLWRAETEFGVYQYWHTINIGWMFDGFSGWNIDPVNTKTEDQAKAAAQADFERRVRECIEDAQLGWLYHNEDTGTEYSKEHPVTSGNCPDALDVRPATADNLLDELISNLKLLDLYQQNLMNLRDDFNDRDIDWDDALNSAALIVEGRSTAVNGDLVKSLIGKNENEIAEILANHDKALSAGIRALSEKPFNKKLMQNGVVSIDLMQRIWANLYFDEEDAGCTFGNTINDVVDWLGDHNALPESCEGFTPAYPLPSKTFDVAASVMRPIPNINCRTPQEVFDMMCDRIRAISATTTTEEEK